MLNRCNRLVKTYRMAREAFENNEGKGLRIRLIRRRLSYGRRYNLPACSEIAALIVGDIDINNTERMVIIDRMVIEKRFLLVMSIRTLDPNVRW